MDIRQRKTFQTKGREHKKKSHQVGNCGAPKDWKIFTL